MRFELWKCRKRNGDIYYNIYDTRQHLELMYYTYTVKEAFESTGGLKPTTNILDTNLKDDKLELISSAKSLEELKGKVIEYII